MKSGTTTGTYNSGKSWTSATGYPTYPVMVAPVVPPTPAPATDDSDDDTVSGTPTTPTKMSDFFSINADTTSIPVGFELPTPYAGSNDGVLGLGASNTAGSTNYVDVLYLNKLISTPMMSISYVLGTSTTFLFGEQPTKSTLYTGSLTAF